MGTHISKGELAHSFLLAQAYRSVKSIDLDIWTPEQMDVRCTLSSNSGCQAYLIRQFKNGVIDARTYIGSGISKLDMYHLISELTGPNRRSPVVADDCSKIESFIRSKYESKRWAMDGPPPSDPSTLEPGGNASSSAPGTARPES